MENLAFSFKDQERQRQSYLLKASGRPAGERKDQGLTNRVPYSYKHSYITRLRKLGPRPQQQQQAAPAFSICSQELAPTYLVTPHITDGYLCLSSFSGVLPSLFHFHNETLNVWTSVLNALFSLWLMRWACSEIPAGTTAFLMFQLHTGLRQLCWWLSAVAHGLGGMGSRWNYWLYKLDFVGIYLCFIGMGSNMLHLELRDHHNLKMFSLICGNTCAVISIVLSLLPRYSGESFRLGRAALFAINQVVFEAPTISGVVSAAISGSLSEPQLYFLGSLVALGLGGVFYVSQWPECSRRWAPGTFDMVLSSHQLWHLSGGIMHDYLFFMYCLTRHLEN